MVSGWSLFLSQRALGAEVLTAGISVSEGNLVNSAAVE